MPPSKHSATSSTASLPTVESLRLESEELALRQELKAALEKAQQAVRQATPILGSNSAKLVPFYLTLSQISLRTQQLAPAEEVLSLVNWMLVKDRSAATATTSNLTSNHGVSKDVGATLKNELSIETANVYAVTMNKLYSELYLATGDRDQALQRASHGAYHSSLLFGPDHIYTSELYFTLGNVFLESLHKDVQKHRRDSEEDIRGHALSMFDKVVEIWYHFLSHPPEDSETWLASPVQKIRLYKAGEMMHTIRRLRIRVLGDKHLAVGEASYTLGLLCAFIGDYGQAKQLVAQAVEIYEINLGEDHASTNDARSAYEQLQAHE